MLVRVGDQKLVYQLEWPKVHDIEIMYYTVILPSST